MFTLLIKHINTLKQNSILIYCLLSILFTYTSFSQNNIDSVFTTKVNSINISKLSEYKTIDSIFKVDTRDSLSMKFLIKKAQDSKNLDVESYATNSLGVIYRNISLYEKSIETHKNSKLLADQANNIELQVINLNMIGVAYRRMDIVKPALDYHTQALNLASSIKNPSATIKYNIAVSQNSMGNIYLVLEQYDLATQQFNKSLKIEKEANNKLGLAINYQNIGFALEAQGNLENALISYKRSLDYNNQINSEIGRVICNNSIGTIYIKQQKFNQAKNIIEYALEKAVKIGDHFYTASSYINLGWVETGLEQYNDSEINLKKGLKIAKTYNLQTSIVEAQERLSELYTKTGKHKLAMLYYKNSIELKETISNQRNLRYVNDVIMQFENEAKNKQIKALADENEIVKSELKRNQKIFWYAIIALVLIAGIAIAFNRHAQLQKEKQIITLEQDMLRSQMNPHFIFNSLNSIKLYIINNEKENAVYYLNKFSKLIRKILIASTEKEISLEDELETMQLYLNIENIRFSNEINFNIVVDENINTPNIKVPSLILQPFLENALWHGLSSKTGSKNINLHVSSGSKSYVTISITDNGIGRGKSAEIKKGKLLKQKSVGIDITKARLANFYKDYKNDYKLQIDDLYSDKGKACGTKVILHIPVVSN